MSFIGDVFHLRYFTGNGANGRTESPLYVIVHGVHGTSGLITFKELGVVAAPNTCVKYNREIVSSIKSVQILSRDAIEVK